MRYTPSDLYPSEEAAIEAARRRILFARSPFEHPFKQLLTILIGAIVSGITFSIPFYIEGKSLEIAWFGALFLTVSISVMVYVPLVLRRRIARRPEYNWAEAPRNNFDDGLS